MNHLLLNWVFDIPNQTVICKIGDNLSYSALEGGTLGYIKRYRPDTNSEFVETKITAQDWSKEKFWISENFGDIVGYYQPDDNRVVNHPIQNRPDVCQHGVGPDGRYIDHMQRMQILLEGEDCNTIGFGTSHTQYVTPDCGKTIFKRVPTRDVHYQGIENTDAWWPEHPQPCAMQPRSPGVRVSSYEEMAADGIPSDAVDKCKAIQWPAPLHPELQQWYVYPTA